MLVSCYFWQGSMYAFAITLIEENLLLLSFYKDLDKNTFL